MGNFIGELQIWDNIRYRISYGADLSFWGYDGYTPKYYLRDGQGQTSRLLSPVAPTASYGRSKTCSCTTRLSASTLSTSCSASRPSRAAAATSAARATIIISYDRPYIDASTGLAANGDQTSSGAPFVKSKLASYFGRASYNFDERYMIQATVRRDGSSRFGTNNHWAVFPLYR